MSTFAKIFLRPLSLCILVLTFLKIIYFFFFVEDVLTFEPHDIAVNMLETSEMKYFLNGQWNYNYQFPIYSMLLFIIYSIIGISTKAAIVLNICLLSGAVLFFAKIIKLYLRESSIQKFITKEKHCIIVAVTSLAFLLNPAINYYALFTVHPFCLDMFVSLLLLLYSYKLIFSSQNNRKGKIILGILISFTLITKPTLITASIPYFLWLLKNSSTTEFLKTSIVIICIALVLPTFWIFRNHLVYGEISIMSSTGQNLWIGIQKETNGSATLENGLSYYSLFNDADKKIIPELTPPNQSRYFINKYLKEAKENPLLLPQMFLIKMQNFWLFRSGIGAKYTSTLKKLTGWYKVYYLLILTSSLCALFFFKDSTILLFSFPFGLSIFQSFFYVETRHRVIIEPILIFLSLLFIVYLGIRVFRKNDEHRI